MCQDIILDIFEKENKCGIKKELTTADISKALKNMGIIIKDQSLHRNIYQLKRYKFIREIGHREKNKKYILMEG
jgi:hypothetical protein